MNPTLESNPKDLPARAIRVGMICPFWLPRHGGGEQYDHRLAIELARQGFDVHVFTGTSASEGRDNGDVNVTRCVAEGDFLHGSWREVHFGPKGESFSKLMTHYTFMSAAVSWCKQNAIQIALISNPLQLTEHAHARELYLQLKQLGIKIGVIHFDLAPQIDAALSQSYLQVQSWASVKTIVQRSLKNIWLENPPTRAFHLMGSPLFFEPDFVVSCSEWSCSFIDPEEITPKIVVHPILDSSYWSATPDIQPLEHREVLMINPNQRKNPTLMSALIESGPSDLRFRVLKGGWGDSFKSFEPTIQELDAYKARRVELLDYVKDVRLAYQAAGLVFFPSLYEGYGMTAVEPMYSGTPVVSSSYPAILEAVGSGAKTLCPYLERADRWITAVSEVLRDREIWAERAIARSKELDARQKTEIAQLCEFLVKQVSPGGGGASGRN
jgi:glycosyltransferase involved in cell wall biosynthesis